MRRESQLYTRWALEVKRSGFFHAGERVGVAVSGGADSILLFDFMKRLARAKGLTLAAVHFNHRLRGAESDADERLVRELSRDGGAEFMGSSADVAQAARDRHANLEATARQLRYRFFFGLVRQGKLDAVATAHTADDQAETVLLRILRGTGSRGLGGIYPALDGGIVRPFLGLTRAEVRAEVAARELRFRTDSSNLDTRLARNKVRAELLPWLAREFNPRIVQVLEAVAARSRDDEAYLEQLAKEQARPWRGRVGTEEKIPLRPLREFHPAIERRVLRQMIAAVRGEARGLGGVTLEHVEALRRFIAEAQSGRHLALPGVTARKEFDWLVIAPGSLGRPTPPGRRRSGAEPPGERPPAGIGERARDHGCFSFPVEAPGAVSVPQLGVTFRFKIVGAEELGKSYNTGRVGFLDFSKLSMPLVLRNWRPGDRFQPAGSRHSVKLKELFTRRKIPLAQRGLWPVLENGGEDLAEIVWVRGFPEASRVSAGAATRQILIVAEDSTV